VTNLTNFKPTKPVMGVIIADPDHAANLSRYLTHKIGMKNLSRNLATSVYYFSIRDIDEQDLNINGLCFEHGQWVKKVAPFPNFLYLSGALEKFSLNQIALLRRAVRECKVRILSAPFEFNKWEVHRILRGSSYLQEHLPETRLWRNINELTLMLRRYDALYLKACRGRRGEQVLRLKLLSDGAVECRYYKDALTITTVKIDNLYSFIQIFFNGRNLIIQQPIDLIEFEGCNVDLRAELQRNGRGVLEIVGIPVRVASAGSPITTHASSYRFEQFFLEMIGYSGAAFLELKQKLYRLLSHIYRHMESNYGPLGEIGIDIGLDKNNRLWMIECNALSAMVSLYNAYGENALNKAFNNLFEYALYNVNKSN